MIDVNIPARSLSNVDLLEIENLPAESAQAFKRLFLNALQQLSGNVAQVCEYIDISRSVYYLWLKTDADFRLAVNDIKEGFVDQLENNAFKVAMYGGKDGTGSAAMLKFLLERQAKHRGYGKESKEIHEHQGAVDHKVWHHGVQLPEPPKDLAEWEEQVNAARERRNEAIEAEYADVEGEEE